MLTAFTAGLLLITVSELGDKTFFIAVLLATRHSRRLVFTAVIAALAAMTLLSVGMGQVAAVLPDRYLYYGEVALFIGFGLKLIYDASQMSDQPNLEVVKEAESAIEEQPKPYRLTGMSQWLTRYPNVNIWVQGFCLTFVAEWGDRTQFSTIALAASNNPIGVSLGAILGHAICAAIAVIGGKLIAGRISERSLTLIGGLLFILFGVFAAIEGK